MTRTHQALHFGAPSHPATLPALAMAALLALGLPGQAMAAEPHISVSPSPVIEGHQVTLIAAGLPAMTAVEVGAGPPFSEYVVLDILQTDNAGALTCTVSLPELAEPGMDLIFVVSTTDFAIKALSAPIPVIGQPMVHIAPQQQQQQQAEAYLSSDQTAPRTGDSPYPTSDN